MTKPKKVTRIVRNDHERLKAEEVLINISINIFSETVDIKGFEVIL